MPALVSELWPVLLDFARRSLPREDAEDVAQEVFVRICSRIADFDPSRDGLSWAFGIASYEILSHRKKVVRRRESFDDTLLEGRADARMSQEDDLIREQLASALTQVIGHISDDDRAQLGLGVAQEAPDVSGATLRKRRQRALERLRIVWRRLYGEP